MNINREELSYALKELENKIIYEQNYELIDVIDQINEIEFEGKKVIITIFQKDLLKSQNKTFEKIIDK